MKFPAALPFVLLAACSGTKSGEPLAIATTEGLEASGTAQMGVVEGIPSLHVRVSLKNRSSDEIRVRMLYYCPVFIRLHAAGAPESPPVFSEEARPCPRAARLIDMVPGEVAVLERAIRLTELREGGVPSGDHHVTAVVKGAIEQRGGVRIEEERFELEIEMGDVRIDL